MIILSGVAARGPSKLSADGEAQAHYLPRIADIPEGERPRERFRAIGPSGLSQRELIAILLGSGTRGRSALALAEELLVRFNGLQGLAAVSLTQLQSVKGVGFARAVQLLAAFELGRRAAMAAHGQRPQITSPQAAAEIFMLHMRQLEQEEVRVMLLDTRNRMLEVPMVCRGSLNAAHLRPADVFREAIRHNSAAVIMAHNHPSGDPSPSPDDIRMTRELHRAGQLLGVELLDHIIIGHDRYVSLKEQGVGFE